MGVKVGVSMVMVQVLVGFIRFGGMEEAQNGVLIGFIECHRSCLLWCLYFFRLTGPPYGLYECLQGFIGFRMFLKLLQ